MEKFIAALEKEGFVKEETGVFARLKFQYFFKEEGGEKTCITIVGKRWYESKRKEDGHITPVANGMVI